VPRPERHLNGDRLTGRYSCAAGIRGVDDQFTDVLAGVALGALDALERAHGDLGLAIEQLRRPQG
jgi:hypothetical protein